MERLPPLRLVALGLLLSAGCIGVSQSRRGPGTSGARCPHGVRPATDGDLDDFEDGNNQLTKLGGRDGYWWSKKDNFGSTLAMMPDDGGAGGSEIAMHATGTTTLGQGDENWGAGFGVDFVSQGRFYDASKYVGIAFQAKAGPKASRQLRFKVADGNTHPDGKVCTRCWNHFGMDLTLTGQWHDYRLLFSELEQEPDWGAPRPPTIDARKLIALDWTLGPGQTFDVWIDDLVLLECRP